MIFWAFIIVFIIFVLFILWRVTSKRIAVSKRVRGSSVTVKIDVKKDIDVLKFHDKNAKKGSGKPPEFIRKNLKKGEKLEFNYVGSRGPISVITVKRGEKKIFEAEEFS